MPLNLLHPDLLTPWQRFTARWLDWQYARIWVQCKGEGWYFMTVRLREGPDATEVLGMTRAYYKQVQVEDTPISISTCEAARLLDFQHMLLTEQAEP